MTARSDERYDRRHVSADRSIRITEIGLELQCLRCGEWWPTLPLAEFWEARRGMATCRACVLEAKRLRMAGLRQDPVWAARKAAEALMEPIRAKRREISLRYRQRHLEVVRARGRDYCRRRRRAATIVGRVVVTPDGLFLEPLR